MDELNINNVVATENLWVIYVYTNSYVLCFTSQELRHLIHKWIYVTCYFEAKETLYSVNVLIFK